MSNILGRFDIDVQIYTLVKQIRRQTNIVESVRKYIVALPEILTAMASTLAWHRPRLGRQPLQQRRTKSAGLLAKSRN